MEDNNQIQDAVDTVEQNSPPTLTVSELSMVANIIDVAVQRSAFKVTEIKQVGEIYEKLAAFVKFVADQQANEKAAS